MTEVEQFPITNDIRHILARIAHPQTNGKLERVYGEVERKLHLFKDIHELVHWYNHIRPRICGLTGTTCKHLSVRTSGRYRQKE
ncbi:MAG TPA: hypothetical protein VNI77_05540 [Nitrososphaera sp.]|nr:hypothetical protein [Nitrososphaera sp.]